MIRNIFFFSSLILTSLLILSCGGSSLSTVGGKSAGHPVNVIAMNSSGGILGEAIAIELTNYDLTVISFRILRHYGKVRY